jgi:hypothetical protein
MRPKFLLPLMSLSDGHTRAKQIIQPVLS